jgi:hypothetical protein
MKQSVTIIALLAISPFSQAFGDIRPGWERPIKKAEMKLVDSQGHFGDAQDIDLTLTRRDGKNGPNKLKVTGMVLEYTINSTQGYRDGVDVVTPLREKRVLIVDQAPTKDSCGSSIYYGQLAKQGQNKDVQVRFNVVLVDHSTRICKDFRPYRWEVSVREGYGWCGTMDATMELVGNPETVYTPRSLELAEEFTTELNLIRE